MPRILFVHQNFPAQFGGIGRYLKDQGWDVLFATAHERADQRKITTLEGLKVIGFSAHRETTEGVHRYIKSTEKAVLNGQGFARTAVRLFNTGYVPDIIVAHSGWGSGSFVKSVWPQARFIQYCEWWYTHPPRDGDPRDLINAEKKKDVFDLRARNQCLNLPFMLDFMIADALLSPTDFQSQTIPGFMREHLRIMHDGVDCDFYSPAQERLATAAGVREITAETPVLTYATRGMEPMRGFMEFMEALSKLQKTNPDVHTVIAGEPTIHYGTRLPEGDTYKKRALEKWEFDHSRIHWVGRLKRPDYRDLLRRSDCHIYLTRPFVLSWSMIESMAVGCPLVVSDNDAVREALPDTNMAIHVDHYDTDALADKMRQVLANPAASREMGQAARQQALLYYDNEILYPMHRDFFLEVLNNAQK